jgi:hypothetical protein
MSGRLKNNDSLAPSPAQPWMTPNILYFPSDVDTQVRKNEDGSPDFRADRFLRISPNARVLDNWPERTQWRQRSYRTVPTPSFIQPMHVLYVSSRVTAHLFGTAISPGAHQARRLQGLAEDLVQLHYAGAKSGKGCLSLAYAFRLRACRYICAARFRALRRGHGFMFSTLLIRAERG